MYALLPTQPQHQHTKIPALVLIQKTTTGPYARATLYTPLCVNAMTGTQEQLLRICVRRWGNSSTCDVSCKSRRYLLETLALYFRVLTETITLESLH